MGHWDELCLLCGISPLPPAELFLDPVYGIEELSDEIESYDPTLLSDLSIDREKLEDLLHSATFLFPDIDSLRAEPLWDSKMFSDCVAIGHFHEDKDQDTPHRIEKTETGWMRKIPDGVGIETRFVLDSICGEFETVVIPGNPAKGIAAAELTKLSRTSSSNYLYHELGGEPGFGNFFLSRACYHYLQAWIDFARLPAPSHNRNLRFAGELYEVVNSQLEGRDNGIGTVPWINYDGIEKTLDQTQDDFRRGLQRPERIISALRLQMDDPAELLRAIIQDFRCWMFCTPNIWPLPSNTREEFEATLGSIYPNATPSGALMQIPHEILFHIMGQVQSLGDYFSVARSSKSLFNVLMDTSNLNRVLKEMSSTPSGFLFWLRPVPDMPGDLENATCALLAWLSSRAKTQSGQLPTCVDPINEGKPVGTDTDVTSQSVLDSALDDLSFPYIPFVRSCFESPSMKNRRRLWGQVKQVERVWREYRVHGWKVDRFGVPLEP